MVRIPLPPAESHVAIVLDAGIVVTSANRTELAMDARGIVVYCRDKARFRRARSVALRLLGEATVDSIMMFEETVPAVTKSTFHLHRDSDEVAYILSGEVTFKIGDEVTVGGPAPAPSCHAACRMPGRAPARKPSASGASEARAKMHKEGLTG